MYVVFGESPTAVRPGWTVVAARGPLRGTVAWCEGEIHFAAGDMDLWWAYWSAAGARPVVYASHRELLDLVVARVEQDGGDPEQLLGAERHTIGDLCGRYDLPWEDP
jgi:hypothetical protein